MGIKTEDMVAYLPPKEITENVDWFGILDSFDPTTLHQRYIDECARRNPYETWYRSDTPVLPVEERTKRSENGILYSRRALQECVDRIESKGLSPVAYKNARAALIKAIGAKGADEYNRREYERLGEAGRAVQAEEYRQWEKEWEEQRIREEDDRIENAWYYEDSSPASVHEKIVKIRKGLKASNGKPLVQRDFAKLLNYPINKYAEAEKVDRYGLGEEESEVDFELLDKLVMIAHANPYWLFDPFCEAFLADEDPYYDAVQRGDQPCVYAPLDVILKWIKEGKPRETNWEDGVVF